MVISRVSVLTPSWSFSRSSSSPVCRGARLRRDSMEARISRLRVKESPWAAGAAASSPLSAPAALSSASGSPATSDGRGWAAGTPLVRSIAKASSPSSSTPSRWPRRDRSMSSRPSGSFPGWPEAVRAAAASASVSKSNGRSETADRRRAGTGPSSGSSSLSCCAQRLAFCSDLRAGLNVHMAGGSSPMLVCRPGLVSKRATTVHVPSGRRQESHSTVEDSMPWALSR
ncbi:hypothetical protein D9M72_457650 [compost metagenome]